jgi:tetratricopeptide (TPR) repeat protein
VLAEALVWLSGAYRRQRAFTEAQQSIEEGMALYQSLGDAAGLALAEVELGILLSNEGDYTGAVPWLSRALDRFLAAGDVRWIAITRVLFGMCLLWTDDDLDHTGRILHTGLLELHEIGERTFMITGLLALARHAAMCSDPVRAATLLGAADALSDAIGVVWTQVNTDTDQSVLDLIRGSLDEPAIAAARAEGRRLSLETALTEADAARAYAPPS